MPIFRVKTDALESESRGPRHPTAREKSPASAKMRRRGRAEHESQKIGPEFLKQSVKRIRCALSPTRRSGCSHRCGSS